MALGALLLVGCLFSQTKVPPGQIQPQPVTGVYVNVAGTKGMVVATVDTATLLLDLSGTVPVLKALPPVVTINEKHVAVKPALGATTLTIPDSGYVPASLSVFVNGLLQSPTDDYTISGTTVTLLRASESGDIDQLAYRF